MRRFVEGIDREQSTLFPAFPTGNAAIDAAPPAAIPNGGGISTTGPGPVSSQLLAGYFGLSATPADQGGSNYATGGARNPNLLPAGHRRKNWLLRRRKDLNRVCLDIVQSRQTCQHDVA